MDTPKRIAAPSTFAVAAAFAIVYVVWGSTYLAIRFAVEALPPFLMAGARFLLAGALLYAVMRPRVQIRPTLRHWRSASVAGVLMLAGANGLVCWAEQYVPSALAALLVATMPLWMVSIDWCFFKGPKPNRSVVTGLVLGLFGILILTGPSQIGGTRVHVPGAIALLVGCILWATGSLYSRRADLHPSSVLVTAMQMLAAGPVLFVLGTVFGEWSRLDLPHVPLKSWLALAYLAVFGSIVALSAYSWLLQVSTPARVATYAYVNPVIAVIVGATLGHEAIESRTWLAVGVILSAVVLITTAAKGRRRAEREAERVRTVPATDIAAGPGSVLRAPDPEALLQVDR